MNFQHADVAANGAQLVPQHQRAADGVGAVRRCDDPRAGHWIQRERAFDVNAALVGFLQSL
ncbi:hypothetical protein [Mycobacterium sp.]|uniref:hypothetical protein n=1 Tax=Mycobacterium sp. TaxID=1785 RepID=UPI0031D1A8B7